MLEITNDTPPEPSSHIVFTLTSAISKPVTTCTAPISVMTNDEKKNHWLVSARKNRLLRFEFCEALKQVGKTLKVPMLQGIYGDKYAFVMWQRYIRQGRKSKPCIGQINNESWLGPNTIFLHNTRLWHDFPTNLM